MTETVITLQGLRDKAVIKKDTPDEKTKGGLILPDVCKERPISGIIRHVGPGCPNDKGIFIPTTLQEGQRVLFPKYSGTNATIEGQEFFIVAEREILAVIESVE